MAGHRRGGAAVAGSLRSLPHRREPMGPETVGATREGKAPTFRLRSSLYVRYVKTVNDTADAVPQG